MSLATWWALMISFGLLGIVFIIGLIFEIIEGKSSGGSVL